MQDFSAPQNLAIANNLYGRGVASGHASVAFESGKAFVNGPGADQLIIVERGPSFANVSSINEHKISGWIKDRIDAAKVNDMVFSFGQNAAGEYQLNLCDK